MTTSDPSFRNLAAPRTLLAAWQRVRRNGGGAGLDGVDVKTFALDAEHRLAALSRSLFAGTYRPRRLLKVKMDKPSGGVRQLAVPALIDRIAQVAAAMVLDRKLDPSFSDASFAYRRGRSVGHALGRILTYRLWGCRWAFDTDIANFFDTIPQDGLLAEAERAVSDRELGRHRKSTPLQVKEELPPGLRTLAHAVEQADDLLVAFGRGADDDKQALRGVLEPGLHVDAVDPEVHVALGREIALAPARMLVPARLP